MTFILAAFLGALAILTAAIAALLVQRRALRKSGAFFRHLADDVPIIMWTTRPDTTLDYLNKFSVEFTGMPLQELLDEGWLNAVHPDDFDRIQRIYVPAVEARRPFSMDTASEEPTASTDGSWIPAFQSMKGTVATPVTSAAVSTLDGKVYITPIVTKEVMERMTGVEKAKEPQLTPRQRDILRLIVKGQRMKEIAANLGLSTRTVEGHKYEMMETLGVTSTAELVRYALDRRLNMD